MEFMTIWGKTQLDVNLSPPSEMISTRCEWHTAIAFLIDGFPKNATLTSTVTKWVEII